jgi:hypothetical protein
MRFSVATLLACVLLCSCSRHSDRDVAAYALASTVATYHDCVPLGWNPVRVMASFYPGFSAEYLENGVWLHPFWLGEIDASDLRARDVRTTFNVLNAMVAAGLLDRTSRKGSYYYRVTLKGKNYYYDGNQVGENPDHLPYMCYSRLALDRIVAASRSGNEIHATFRVRIDRIAEWSDNPVLRSNRVELPPADSVEQAVLRRSNADWQVLSIRSASPMLPRFTRR